MTPFGMAQALQDNGFYIGPRDPERNTEHTGAYMVAEPLPDDVPKPTLDARDGAFCLVGDDLAALVVEAYEHNLAW